MLGAWYRAAWDAVPTLAAVYGLIVPHPPVVGGCLGMGGPRRSSPCVVGWWGASAALQAVGAGAARLRRRGAAQSAQAVGAGAALELRRAGGSHRRCVVFCELLRPHEDWHLFGIFGPSASQAVRALVLRCVMAEPHIRSWVRSFANSEATSAARARSAKRHGPDLHRRVPAASPHLAARFCCGFPCMRSPRLSMYARQRRAGEAGGASRRRRRELDRDVAVARATGSACSGIAVEALILTWGVEVCQRNHDALALGAWEEAALGHGKPRLWEAEALGVRSLYFGHLAEWVRTHAMGD